MVSALAAQLVPCLCLQQEAAHPDARWPSKTSVLQSGSEQATASTPPPSSEGACQTGSCVAQAWQADLLPAEAGHSHQLTVCSTHNREAQGMNFLALTDPAASPASPLGSPLWHGPVCPLARTRSLALQHTVSAPQPALAVLWAIVSWCSITRLDMSMAEDPLKPC